MSDMPFLITAFMCSISGVVVGFVIGLFVAGAFIKDDNHGRFR